jgi:hypothetical protein
LAFIPLSKSTFPPPAPCFLYSSNIIAARLSEHHLSLLLRRMASNVPRLPKPPRPKPGAFISAPFARRVLQDLGAGVWVGAPTDILLCSSQYGGAEPATALFFDVRRFSLNGF